MKIEWRPWTNTPFPFAELEQQQKLEQAALMRIRRLRAAMVARINARGR